MTNECVSAGNCSWKVPLLLTSIGNGALDEWNDRFMLWIIWYLRVRKLFEILIRGVPDEKLNESEVREFVIGLVQCLLLLLSFSLPDYATYEIPNWTRNFGTTRKKCELS